VRGRPRNRTTQCEFLQNGASSHSTRPIWNSLRRCARFSGDGPHLPGSQSS
jgi:hypothetical protein